MGLGDFWDGAKEQSLKRPRIEPGRGSTDLTTSDSSILEPNDPYAGGTEYGQAETNFQIKDPYKSLTQVKKQPGGVLKPNKKTGVYQ